MTNNLVSIIAQAFYGNRTQTEIKKENVDRFILGILDNSMPILETVDRTVIPIPNLENLVIVYNKNQEAKKLEDKEKYFEDDGYELKPLAFIPEKNLEIYSRCIVCRINEEGELESIEEGDYEKLIKYLAE